MTCQHRSGDASGDGKSVIPCLFHFNRFFVADNIFCNISKLREIDVKCVATYVCSFDYYYYYYYYYYHYIIRSLFTL